MAKSTVKFSSLAENYYPGCNNSKNAVRCLSRSIKRCSPLLTELRATGFGPYNHRNLTLRQVRAIIKYLGPPNGKQVEMNAKV